MRVLFASESAHMTHELIPAGLVESSVLLIRGRKVVLDQTLAGLYGVSTKVLNQAVKRNPARFPANFMFQLTTEEARAAGLRSRPYAFTEHGILMLSSVFRSERALQVNIELMRMFDRIRETAKSNAELTKRLDALEHDCRVVIEAMRKPSRRAIPKRRIIGFRATAGKR
jgi:phage regulator Rha-like protein